MGRRRGIFIPLPGGSGALLGSGAQAMPADFLHSTSRASNMALWPPPAVRQDGRSENFGPFRSGSGGRGWEASSALSGDCERSGFFGNTRGRLRPPFGSAPGLTRFLGKDRSCQFCVPSVPPRFAFCPHEAVLHGLSGVQEHSQTTKGTRPLGTLPSGGHLRECSSRALSKKKSQTE